MATWYVRPGAGHGGTNAGTSYANAWQGWSSIVWGGVGVVGGDTLYVCGAHSYAANILVGAHGGSSAATVCNIRGDYSADPGTITFSGNSYLYKGRAWTHIVGLSFVRGTSPCIVWGAPATNSGVYDCDLASDGTAADTRLIHIYSEDGQTHTNLTIDGNTFRDHARTSISGQGNAIEWFITGTNQTSILNGLAITNNTFRNIGQGRAVIGLRAEDDTNAASRITGLVIDDNTFEDCVGITIDIGSSITTAGICGTARIKRNVVRNGQATGVLGGFVSAYSWSSLEVADNEAYEIAGPAGFCNLFYCLYPRVLRNYVDGIDTATIDGNGVLFDHGNVGGIASSNVFKNLRGKDGIPYSGVGVMILDSTGVVVCGNLCETVKTGVHVGNSTGGQSALIVNNTFVDVQEYGVHTSSTASALNSVEVKQNIFVGDGYSVFDQSGVSWTSEDRNYFYGFASGASNHTLGANSSTADPLLDDSYRPMRGSPVLKRGAHIPGLWFNGMPCRAKPDIGAFQRFDDRTVRLVGA